MNASPLVINAVEFGRSTLPASVRVETDVDLELPSVSISKVHVEQIVMNLFDQRTGRHGRKGRTASQLEGHCSPMSIAPHVALRYTVITLPLQCKTRTGYPL